MNISSTVIVIALSSLLSGCFYFVDEGKGGVAERYPISKKDERLSERLRKSETLLNQQQLTQQRTQRFHMARLTLNQSMRLYEAGLLKEADKSLAHTETLLEKTGIRQQSVASQPVCNITTTGGACE